MRGQAATEFLLILAFLLLLTLPVGYTLFAQSTESSRIIQGRLAVRTLKETADFVYAQGPGARIEVDVLIPDGVDWPESYMGKPGTADPTVEYKEINLRLYTSAGYTDIFEPVEGDVRGIWPDTAGMYRFVVRMTDDGYVLISPYELTFLLEPGSYAATMQPTNTTSFSITLTSLTTTAQTITLADAGSTESWVNLSATTVNLGGGANESVTVTISIPNGTASGYYTGEITAESDNVTQSTYLYITVAGQQDNLCIGDNCGIPPSTNFFVRILEPENTTYSTAPINLTFETNESYEWCGYALNDGDTVPVAGNTSILVAGGEYKVEVFCVGPEGAAGLDTEWFTVNMSTPEPWCFNLTALSATDHDKEDELADVLYSDNVRADEVGIQYGVLTFIEVDFALALPGNSKDIAIHSVTQWIEHYEDSNQMDLIVQWKLSNGWGATVCALPSRFPNTGSEATDVCSLIGSEAMSNPGKTERLSTRVFYLPHSASTMSAYMDYTQVEVCYGEAMKQLNIISPLNQTYPSGSVTFNVTSNAWIDRAYYSLDGAANVTMSKVSSNYSAQASQAVSDGPHTVVFYANDTNGNYLSNVSYFSVGGADTTPPVITIESPTNNTYTTNNVHANATL
ncbi:MAG: hypothetical protein JW834_01095, partial [Candidatus Diapherotrites archaeon]|nr:hypothetical protein [Candidatus Diapherotrites archaeon]